MKAKEYGEISFWLTDYREDKLNEGVRISFPLFLENEKDELLEIPDFISKCKYFLLAMGYAEETINKYFKE